MDTRMLSDRGKNVQYTIQPDCFVLCFVCQFYYFTICFLLQLHLLTSAKSTVQCADQLSIDALTTKCVKKSRSTLRSYDVSNFRSRNILQIQYKAQCRWEYKNYKHSLFCLRNLMEKCKQTNICKILSADTSGNCVMWPVKEMLYQYRDNRKLF